MRRGQPISVLLVEDNEIDARMVLRAAASSRLANQITVVNDGAKALAFLAATEHYSNRTLPDLILLDLNLPGVDGRDVLNEVKASPDWCHIPVVILTSSDLEEDVLSAYRADAAAFVTKPVGMNGFVKVVEAVEHFWVEIVSFPDPAASV